MSNVYVKCDSLGNVLNLDGGRTVSNITDPENWILIDSGSGDKYDLCQSCYLDEPLFVYDVIPNYKLVNGKPVKRSHDEIQADLNTLPEIETPTVTLERENKKLKAQISVAQDQITFLEECILEMGEIVYA